MDVYVESNFVLEIALLQEQHASCEKIIQLAEEEKIRLIVPAYSLIEPYETVVRYAKSRTKISNDLANEVKQLSRSKPYKEEASVLQKVNDFLIQSQQEEKSRLRSTVDRLTTASRIVSLDARTLIDANKYQIDHDLSPQDSIVYASILGHLAVSNTPAKCFLNRNSKDFDDPDIIDNLSTYRCKMLFNFDDGYNYISSQVS